MIKSSKKRILYASFFLAVFLFYLAFHAPKNATVASPMHIGFIFQNAMSRELELEVALKSLHFYASCDIQLHFATDNSSKALVQNFFDKNNFERVKDIKFHTLKEVETRLQNISSGFRDRAALYKLSPELIFKLDHELLLVDFDLLIVQDLCTPYQEEIDKLRKSKSIIGIASEFGTYESRNFKNLSNPLLWLPDYQFGLNTGIMLLDLPRLRKENWTEKILSFINLNYANDLSMVFEYGEQTAINLFLERRPELVHFLSPSWNFQVFIFSLLDVRTRLFPFIEKIVIFHGNAKRFYDPTVPFQLPNLLWWIFVDPLKRPIKISNMLSNVNTTDLLTNISAKKELLQNLIENSK